MEIEDIADEELARTVAADPRASLRPDPEDRAERLESVLAELRESGGIAFERQETLGVGGMGVVHAARQATLDRRVAVKSLRAPTQHRMTQLLQEAWITGRLEHPNIVPVHDLRLDDDGPELVMQEIAGTPWSELMHDAATLSKRFATDPLDWNLRTLMQVCHAVELAHSRGILHRDLKPENVMIGDFGEVFLLDWGIAVSLRDDPSGRLPLLRDAVGVAGTPVYMAPEMLGGDPTQLSERSDVYLLGATLYELLAGSPPHMREDASTILFAIAMSEPERTDDDRALDEIWAVCLRALSASPDERFESVEAFRRRLQTFLDHRAAQALVEQASLRLLLLERATEGRIDTVERAELYRLFAECRFGFRQAQLEWPESARARDGVARAITLMVEYELAKKKPEAAQTLLAELAEPSPELAARVERACGAHEIQRKRLEALAKLGETAEREQDPGVGVRARLAIAGLLGGAMSLTPFLYAWFLKDLVPPTHVGLVLFTTALLALVGAAAFLARHVLLATALNRNFFAAIFAALGGQIVLNLGCWAIDLPITTIRILDLCAWFIAAAYGAFVTQAAFLPTAIGYLVGFALAALFPDYVFEITGAANSVLTVNVIVVWWPLLTGRPSLLPPSSLDA